MLDLKRYARIRLHARPLAQRFIAAVFLAPQYHLYPGVKLSCEYIERLPNEPVIFAMNHTDAFNYWPFQYWMHRNVGRYTATWVKGKNYEQETVGRFMEWTNNIPVVSRGYLLTRDFMTTTGRRPTDDEYRDLRALIDRTALGDAEPGEKVDAPAILFTRARDMLGRRFDPQRETYAEAINRLFRTMMDRFAELHREASALGLDILVFPQGTRSVRLSKGHSGLAQMALHLKRPIVPVGCNNSDLVYKSKSPFPGPGAITYRMGEPIYYDPDMTPFHIPEGFAPFEPKDELAHKEKFQGLVDLVMDRINDLLDERHKYSDDKVSGGVSGSSRFV